MNASTRASFYPIRAMLLFCLVTALLPARLVRATPCNQQPDSRQILKAQIAKQCAALAIPYPIETASLQKKESRAYVEQALENAINQSGLFSSKVLIRNGTVEVELTAPVDPRERKESKHDGVWYGSLEAEPDLFQPALDELRSAMPEAISRSFKEEIEMKIHVVNPPNDGYTQTASMGDSRAKDLLSGLIVSNKINYEATWYEVKQVLRQNSMSIVQEDNLNGTFAVDINRTTSSDADWLYQSFQRVSLRDPYSHDVQKKGEYLTIKVVLVVKKRKRLTSFYPPAERSGPDEDRILQLILERLEKPQP